MSYNYTPEFLLANQEWVDLLVQIADMQVEPQELSFETRPEADRVRTKVNNILFNIALYHHNKEYVRKRVRTRVMWDKTAMKWKLIIFHAHKGMRLPGRPPQTSETRSLDFQNFASAIVARASEAKAVGKDQPLMFESLVDERNWKDFVLFVIGSATEYPEIKTITAKLARPDVVKVDVINQRFEPMGFVASIEGDRLSLTRSSKDET